MSGKRRLSFEAGHRPKFLVIIDDTQECDRAVRFAARRALHIGAGLVMLTLIDDSEFQQWLGVGDVMKAEAEAEANGVLERYAAQARAIAGVTPEKQVRAGKKAEAIFKLIEDDQDISFLVLAAGMGADGPGPLVSMLAGKASATFPIPVVVVPGNLADDEIDALA